MSSEPPAELARARGIARLLATLGAPATVEGLAARVCDLARAHLGADAAALFLGSADAPGQLTTTASAGLASEPPAGVLGALSPADRDPLRAWAAHAGYHNVALTPIDCAPAGLLALFLVDGVAFADDDLRTLAAGVAQALGHVRGVHDLTRAAE